MPRGYAIRYNFRYEKGNFEDGDVDPKTQGLTDALLIVSVVRSDEKEGGRAISCHRVSIDGQSEDGEIPGPELFHIWSMFAKELSDTAECHEWQKILASAAFEAIRDTVLQIKNRDGV